MTTEGSAHLTRLRALDDATWRRADAFHGVHDVVPGQLARLEEIAEAEHEAALAAIRRRTELADAMRALDPPTVPIPVVRDRGPVVGPPPPSRPEPVPADVARMAAELRSEAVQAGPTGRTTPSNRAVCARFGVGREKARDVLTELDRTAPERTR